jgi:hypothetical protein
MSQAAQNKSFVNICAPQWTELLAVFYERLRDQNLKCCGQNKNWELFSHFVLFLKRKYTFLPALSLRATRVYHLLCCSCCSSGESTQNTAEFANFVLFHHASFIIGRRPAEFWKLFYGRSLLLNRGEIYRMALLFAEIRTLLCTLCPLYLLPCSGHSGMSSSKHTCARGGENF